MTDFVAWVGGRRGYKRGPRGLDTFDHEHIALAMSDYLLDCSVDAFPGEHVFQGKILGLGVFCFKQQWLNGLTVLSAAERAMYFMTKHVDV